MYTEENMSKKLCEIDTRADPGKIHLSFFTNNDPVLVVGSNIASPKVNILFPRVPFSRWWPCNSSHSGRAAKSIGRLQEAKPLLCV